MGVSRRKGILLFGLLACFASSSGNFALADFDEEFNKDITKGFFKKSFDENFQIDKPKSNVSGKSLNKSVDAVVQKAQAKLEKEMRYQQADFQLYLQMQKVSNYLNQWCVWNHRWPSYVLEVNQIIVQLAELVPNNPYIPAQLQEASGRSTDPNYRYLNQPLNQFYHGEAADGFAPDSFVPNNSYEAYGAKKIYLEMNPSLTAEMVVEWENNPPLSWRRPPGTITAISNNEDLIVVWGAGADQRPIHVPGGKKIRLFVSNILMEGEADNY